MYGLDTTSILKKDFVYNIYPALAMLTRFYLKVTTKLTQPFETKQLYKKCYETLDAQTE